MSEEFIERPERRIDAVLAIAAATVRPYRMMVLVIATIAGLGGVFYVGRGATGDLLLTRPSASELPLLAESSGHVSASPPPLSPPVEETPSAIPAPVLDGGGPYLVFAVEDPEGHRLIAADMSSAVADDPATTKALVTLERLSSQPFMVNQARQWGGSAVDIEAGSPATDGTPGRADAWMIARGSTALRGPFTIPAPQEGVLSSDGRRLAAFTGDSTNAEKVNLSVFTADAAPRRLGTFYRGGEKGMDGQLHPVAWGVDGSIYAVHVCYCDGVSLPQDFLSFDIDGRMQPATWLGVWTGFDFSVSADGRWIAYLGASCASCSPALTVADTKAHTIHRLQAASDTVVTPIVSPSGRSVAYFDPSSRQIRVRSVATGVATNTMDIDASDVQLMAWLDEHSMVALARTTIPGTGEQTISLLVLTPGTPPTETGASTNAIDNIYHGPDVTFLGWIR